MKRKEMETGLSVLTTTLEKDMTPADFFGETYFEITTSDGSGTVGYALDENHADLFAAAPDMLRVLRAVRHDIQHGGYITLPTAHKISTVLGQVE